MRQRIAITGANGYLASLVQRYNAERFEFVRVSRADVDYTKPDEVARFFSDLDFDLLFHTAANATTARLRERSARHAPRELRLGH